MTDSHRYDYPEPACQSGVSATDFNRQLINECTPTTGLYRPPSLSAEPGPPPTIQPRSNYDKFPDTSGPRPWWPADSHGPHGPNWPVSREDAPGGFGVHWIDVPPVVLPWPPPGKPPAPPGKVPDGPVYKPDPIQPPRLDDDAARKSVNINADARSIYLTAGLTGAGMGTGIHFADVYTGGIDPGQRTGLAAFWRNNLSPSQALVPERSTALQAVESQLPGLRNAATAAERAFDSQVRSRVQLADKLVSQIPYGPMSATDANWYCARVGIVKDNLQFQPANILANAGTDAEVQMRQRLFTQSEASQMASQSADYWRDSNISAEARTALSQTEGARADAAQMLRQAERGSVTTGPEAFLKGAGQGLLVATASVVADNLLDRALGNSPELSNQAHWGVQGIGMPLLLLSKATPTTKVLGAIAMVGVSHTLDQYLGPPTGVFSAFARPSLPEIGLATAGALVPVQDMRVRAGLAVTGWLAGKAWNYLDDRYELTGKSEPRLRDAASAAVDMDMKWPSIDRFNFAVNEMHKFSDKNDAASAVLINDWQSSNSTRTSVEKERGSAALMLGFGESLLARGSRIDHNAFEEKGDRLLSGLNYDLGGQATTYLRSAAFNLQEASKIARENRGAALSSGTIDDAYLRQLELEKDQADQVLEQVYGGHDMVSVYSQLRKQVSAHYAEMSTFAENLDQYSRTISNTEPRFKAKISRDLALIHTAFSELETTASGKATQQGSARGYLDTAAGLDPGAPDQAAIQALLNSAR